MTKFKLLTVFIALVSFVQIAITQTEQLDGKETKILACLSRHFRPAHTAVWSDVKKDFEIVRCTKPSERLCDVSAGIGPKNYAGAFCLIDAGFDFNADDGALFMKAAIQDADLLKLLFRGSNPFNPDLRDGIGRTLLVRMSQLSPPGLIRRNREFSWDAVYYSSEFLLQKGADPNATSPDGLTSLMLQASFGMDKFVELLLRYKADPNIQSKEGKTALMMASDEPGKIKMLLDANANVYLKDINGWTALDHAVKACQINKVRLILAEDPGILQAVDADGKARRTYLAVRRSTNCPEINGLLSF